MTRTRTHAPGGRKKTILFIQLPRLDHDTVGAHENVPLAGVYLAHALDRCAPGVWDCVVQPPGIDTQGDRALVDLICGLAPHTIAATVYLWNIERTLWVLQRVRQRLPQTRIVAGGPEATPDNALFEASPVADAIVSGEGEHVAQILAGGAAEFLNTAARDGSRYTWGTRKPPSRRLSQCLPPSDDPRLAPDRAGMAYIETVRGCPMRCAYCCYNQRRRTVDFLPPGEIARRLETLRERGAREIRFIDPTFNSHPRFDAVLDVLCRINADRSLRFFAEARAETLSPRQIAKLARANVTDLEVGVQSRDPAVLRAIGRPCNQGRMDAAIAALADSGVRPTVDLMAGLPLQTWDDIRRSLDWAAGLRNATAQLMHTLLLPGTELRRTWSRDLRAQTFPPYRVLRTRLLSARRLAEADALAGELTGGRMDTPTRRFVGRRLPGLFAERIAFATDPRAPLPDCDGRRNRRAVFFSGDDLFGAREWIASAIRRCVAREPHILWQFVLRPRHEEPLDLLDRLSDVCRSLRPLVLDAALVGGTPRDGRRVSARIFVQLDERLAYDPAWADACETTLRARFH